MTVMTNSDYVLEYQYIYMPLLPCYSCQGADFQALLLILSGDPAFCQGDFVIVVAIFIGVFWLTVVFQSPTLFFTASTWPTDSLARQHSLQLIPQCLPLICDPLVHVQCMSAYFSPALCSDSVTLPYCYQLTVSNLNGVAKDYSYEALLTTYLRQIFAKKMKRAAVRHHGSDKKIHIIMVPLLSILQCLFTTMWPCQKSILESKLYRKKYSSLAQNHPWKFSWHLKMY